MNSLKEPITYYYEQNKNKRIRNTSFVLHQFFATTFEVTRYYDAKDIVKSIIHINQLKRENNY